jgi:4-alpha-glucanotransferase
MALSDQEGYVWGMIRTAFASVSDLCVVPLQDYLDIGAEGRMNFPGTMTDANWTWRAGYEVTNRDLCARIRKLTELYGRLGNQE